MITPSKFVLTHLQVKNRSGFEWLCLCPYHKDTTPSFSVNLRKRVFICYACGAKGTMQQLMEYMGVVDSVQKDEISLTDLTEKIKTTSDLLHQTTRPTVGMPYNSRFTNDKEAIEKYWALKRGLSSNAIETYNLGYDSLAEQAIIPIADFDDGRCIGIIRRNTLPDVTPRYLYSRGMKISDNVFGAWQAKTLTRSSKNSVLVITEGAIDAMSVTTVDIDVGATPPFKRTIFMGVAVLGSRMSNNQARIIKKLGFQNIIIATDMDRAGRMAQTQISSALSDIRTGALIYRADWNIKLGKDLNELTHHHRQFVLFDALHLSPLK